MKNASITLEFRQVVEMACALADAGVSAHTLLEAADYFGDDEQPTKAFVSHLAHCADLHANGARADEIVCSHEGE